MEQQQKQQLEDLADKLVTPERYQATGQATLRLVEATPILQAVPDFEPEQYQGA